MSTELNSLLAVRDISTIIVDFIVNMAYDYARNISYYKQ